MSNIQTETEVAYEWVGQATIIQRLDTITGWARSEEEYTLIDSVYDTDTHEIGNASTGVRVRTKYGKTVMTAKKFLRRNASGAAVFEERHVQYNDDTHPLTISTGIIDLDLPVLELKRQLSFENKRIEVSFKQNNSLVRIVNEEVTYSNSFDTYQEPLLEIEFENVLDETIKLVLEEIQSKYNLKVIHEGKTDRANRFLKASSLHIENLSEVETISMSAHGGKGQIKMKFFHTQFSGYDGADEPKATDYKNGNWEFFAHSILPIGSEVKEHLHDRTDEIYYILNGSALFTVDGESQTVNKGDCILTRKNSVHSLTNVTEDLEFIATEIL